MDSAIPNSARAALIGETAWPFGSPLLTGHSAIGHGFQRRRSVSDPWPTLFETAETRDDAQKYKHQGCFHIGYMSAATRTMTRRITRHVPFLERSNASRYERLKAGLVLYRLVFGQVDQEDLLEHLQQQTGGPRSRCEGCAAQTPGQLHVESLSDWTRRRSAVRTGGVGQPPCGWFRLRRPSPIADDVQATSRR